MKLIYIVGDGRSGSTLLDAILSNASSSISIGEGYRFWTRFYRADTLCGCAEKIENCELWSSIHRRLSHEIEGYNPDDVWEKIQFLLKFKNISHIPKIISKPEWKSFCDIVTLFYKYITDITKQEIIIDSSKSNGWLMILISLNISDIKVIHLERNLEAVVNSWKKKIILPEFYGKEEYMPVKSTYTSVKSWLKVKYLFYTFKNKTDHKFIQFEKFIKDPKYHLSELNNAFQLDIPLEKMYFNFNHSIGGNPMRNKQNEEIIIQNEFEELKNLNIFEWVVLSLLNRISKFIL